MKRLLRKASMTLYHGTSSEFLDNVAQQGLTPGVENGNSNSKNSDGTCVYVTNIQSEGKYYADEVAKEHGGEPVVLELNLDTSKLLPDENIFNYGLHPYQEMLNGLKMTPEEFEYEWGYGPEYADKTFFVDYDLPDPEPFVYEPGQEPFVGEQIFTILGQDLAKYPGTIPPEQITNLKQELEKVEAERQRVIDILQRNNIHI